MNDTGDIGLRARTAELADLERTFPKGAPALRPVALSKSTLANATIANEDDSIQLDEADEAAGFDGAACAA